MSSRIAIIGDLPPDNRFHILTNKAIEHAAAALGIKAEVDWIGTAGLAQEISDSVGLAAQKLTNYHGLWIAPGSPYQSMDGALAAIQHARENHVPLLGTCGG